ncbi:hypothetical protein [Arthrobacter sp. JSM 101049]|uniref:hypothetical protein n=1 Tax=Arthrobacter sp. JSM 101049 TaxID=929097 RepID=UPI003562DE4F
MQDRGGRKIPQAEEHPLLGGNRVTSAFRDGYDPEAGPKRLWPIAVGLVTAVSVLVVLLFVVF